MAVTQATPISGASFAQGAPPATEEVERGIDIKITGDPEDSVEIGNPPLSPASYGPNTTADRFGFEMQNGMLNGCGRFNAVRDRFRSTSAEVHDERGSIEGQVTRGLGRSQSGLFSLLYADADPNHEEARSQVEGRVGFTRMGDQGLELLKLL